MASNKRYASLKEFYPYYLTEHQNTVCRLLHFTGTGLLFVLAGISIYLSEFTLLWYLPFTGYGFAWVGHFCFEKNKPATFQYPLYSLVSDFLLFFDLLRGKEKFKALKR
jgi:hypothetical protein